MSSLAVLMSTPASNSIVQNVCRRSCARIVSASFFAARRSACVQTVQAFVKTCIVARLPSAPVHTSAARGGPYQPRRASTSGGSIGTSRTLATVFGAPYTGLLRSKCSPRVMWMIPASASMSVQRSASTSPRLKPPNNTNLFGAPVKHYAQRYTDIFRDIFRQFSY